MMDSFESFEQTSELVSGKSYWTYVRVASRNKDTIRCDVYVYDSEEMIMQCSGLRFHEVRSDILGRLPAKATPVSASKKDLIDRCSSDAALMELLEANDIPTKAYPGFMEDPKMGSDCLGLAAQEGQRPGS
jgi:zearalenone synthase (nonreducing iterative type I polyketide synthase)